MSIVQIKKQKSLSGTLRALEIGVWAEIKNKEYRPLSVRMAISNLSKEGYSYECTEKGCIDYIKVRRIK